MKISCNMVLCLMLGVCSMTFSSCKEEKKSNNIITKIKPKPKTPQGPQQISSFEYEKNIEWLGNHYTIRINRHADKTLPIITDADGKKYYDNKIELVILRSDGTKFFNKTFQKDDFKEFTNNKYGKKGAFTGFMFDKIEGSTLKFGASIGSPDPNSDEFIPMEVFINNFGHVKITSLTQIANEDENKSETSDKKPKTEPEEEEGV